MAAAARNKALQVCARPSYAAPHAMLHCGRAPSGGARRKEEGGKGRGAVEWEAGRLPAPLPQRIGCCKKP